MIDLSSREARDAEAWEFVEEALARWERGTHASRLHERSGVLNSRKRMKSMIGSKPARCQILPSCVILGRMSTMNISLPETLKEFVDEQVAQGGYGTSSEYVRELIRKDQGRLQLRNLLLEGAGSKPCKPVSPEYFNDLRRQATKRRKR